MAHFAQNTASRENFRPYVTSFEVSFSPHLSHCIFFSFCHYITNHDPRDAVNAPRHVLADFFRIDIHPMFIALIKRLEPVVHKLLMSEAFIFRLFHCGGRQLEKADWHNGVCR